MPSEPSRILIIKPSSLGDIIHALPFLHALRRRFPKAFLSWLVKGEWAPILEGHPALDEVLPVRFRLGEIGSLLRAVRRDFDWVIDLQGLFRSGLLSRLSGAKVRIGLSDAREGAGWFYNHTVSIPQEPLHAVDRYLLVGRSFGLDDSPRLFVLPDLSRADRSLEDRVQAQGIPSDRPWIAFHTVSRRVPKQWSIKRFAALADLLVRERKVAVIFVGSRDEREAVQEVLRRMSEPAYNMAGETGLLELAALLSRVSLLVCNDSGPMHLAAALGTGVVAIFGPTDPRKVGPYGKGHRVLKGDASCGSCTRSRCARSGACLAAISVDAVAEAIFSSLEVCRKAL